MGQEIRYTLRYELMGKAEEEDCFVDPNVFHPYGEPKVGDETRGEFGFFKVVEVFDDVHPVYGKFIAVTKQWEDLEANRKYK